MNEWDGVRISKTYELVEFFDDRKRLWYAAGFYTINAIGIKTTQRQYELHISLTCICVWPTLILKCPMLIRIDTVRNILKPL